MLERINIFKRWHDFKEKQNKAIRFILEVVEFIILLVVIATIVHQGFVQRRFIPTQSMLPYLQPHDHLIVERVSLHLQNLGIGKEFKRGDIIVFYPPFIELSNSPGHLFARLTGFSRDVKIGPLQPFFFLPETESAYIKRIVALPGETVKIIENDGVYINGKKLIEKYPNPEDPQQRSPFAKDFPLEKPNYSMTKLEDIPHLNPQFIQAANGNGQAEVVVPEGHYFCLGDNRNDSFDGHMWGFVPKNRIIGKAQVLIWRNLKQFTPYVSTIAAPPETPITTPIILNQSDNSN